MRNVGFFMHNRARYFVQQGNGAKAQVSWNFVAPSTIGDIRTIISDGADGWYVGGSFSSITDSVATYTTGYTRLVRLRADGTIDPAFSCPVGLGEVRALALDSTGLYIGGNFTGTNSVGTSARNRIARVRPFNDPSPGAVDAWNPGASSVVRDLALDSANGKVYVCGEFNSIGGTGTNNSLTTRPRIARFPTGATATVDAWNPNLTGLTGFSCNSLALDAVNGKLYIGGNFTGLGGTGFSIDPAETRRGVARLTTGASATLDAWNPNVTGRVDSILYDAANSKLYMGGTLTSVGATSGADITPAQTRNRVARLTTGASATLDGWDPNVSIATGDAVSAIAHDTANGFVYLGGIFTTIGGTGRNRIARVSDGATATLDGWDPNVSVAIGTASVNRILLYPAPGKAIIVGNFSAIANQVDSLGNDIAGLDL
jgi:hypothetical protein